MKFRPIISLCLLSFSGNALALNPMNGGYAGITLGGAYTPPDNLVFNLPATPNSISCSNSASCIITSGKLKYDTYFDFGFEAGLRFDELRLEIQGLYINNPYQKIKSGDTKYKHSKKSQALIIKGATDTGAAFLNAYYDIFTRDSDLYWVPYIGGGLGYAIIKDNLKFRCQQHTIACSRISDKTTTPLVQGILGLAYFMDDFTWFALDFRYVTAKDRDNFVNAKFNNYIFNLTVNGVFYCA